MEPTAPQRVPSESTSATPNEGYSHEYHARGIVPL